MQALLTKFDDNCFNSLIENLSLVRNEPTMEGVHTLRLSIKRIRALLKLLDQDTSTYGSEVVKQIDGLFRYSGELRDIQVQSILLESYRERVGGVVDLFQKEIFQESKRIKKQFKIQVQSINHFDLVLINQRLDNCIEALSDETLDGNCIKKVDVLLNQICQMYSESQEDKNLHRIRIKLKELLYFISILKKGKIKIKYDIILNKRLNSLQQKLGDWHDLELLLNRIVRIEKPNEGGSILLFHLAKDKNKLKLEIVGGLNKLRELVIQ